jgi:phospholipase/carboxylesterase
MSMTRREAILASLAALASRCATVDPPEKLRARPTGSASTAPGLYVLPLERRTLLYVPEGSRGFMLVLHGATQTPDRMIERFHGASDDAGVTLLAPKSEGPTWDAIQSSFGPDARFLDRALNAAFARITIDRKRIAVGGFSDGATYAIALGLANGDLFSHVLAFSPGFLIRVTRVGAARFFLSHGTSDPILPIDGASRPIARELRRANLSVKLREFDGGHTVPPEVAREAFQWLSG